MNFSYMKDFMDALTSWRIPGNDISVCVEGKEVFRYQSGYCDYENKIPMTDDKLINIYSCSKVATVTAALQLYERGKFLLDDPLYDFIPEYKEMYIKKEDGELVKAENAITLRHLFTMTSGLTYNTESEHIAAVREKTNGKMPTLEVIKAFAKEPISFEPGERWQYSMSHDVLAAVVEVISGKKFSDYVRENIFEPLGMKDAYYHNEGVLDRVAKQYRYINSTEDNLVNLQSGVVNKTDGYIQNIDKKAAHVFGPEYDSGGAGITTSVEEYSKFASALANGGVGSTGERIIASSTIELLRTPQIYEGLNWKQLKGYAYGLGVRTLVSKAASGSTGSVGEFGWGGAAGATVLVDPDKKLSMFYTHHMLNPQEAYYQPRLRNVLYTCING